MTTQIDNSNMPKRILKALAQLSSEDLQHTLGEIKKSFKSQSPIHLVASENAVALVELFKNADFTFIDVETTGVDKKEDAVTEVAAIRFTRGKVSVIHQLVDPLRDIPAGASALTGIRNHHVKGKPSLWEIRESLIRFVGDSQPVAHNAPFDSAFIDFLEKPWLCTLRLARHLYPNAPDHKNATLFTWLDPDNNPPGEGYLEAHRALDDVIMSIENLKYLAREAEEQWSTDSFDALLQRSNKPIAVALMPLGKHKGKGIHEIPSDFLNWALFKDGGGMKDRLVEDHDLAYALCAAYVQKGGRIPLGHWIFDNPYIHNLATAPKQAPTDLLLERNKTETLDLMPFGRHQGLPLGEVPVSYLVWAVSNDKFVDRKMHALAESKIDKRSPPAAVKTKILF